MISDLEPFVTMAEFGSAIIIAIIIFLVIAVAILIAWAVFYCIGTWKLFEKAGQPGWKAIVPFYNT